MNPLIQLKQTTSVFLIAFGLACFGLSPTARAVSPPPDGGYPGQNTAEGDSALLNLTTGTANTAIGFSALASNTTSFNNTAIGYQALFTTNIGNGANTAVGESALFSDTSWEANTAVGAEAMFDNTTGVANTAVGVDALHANTGGLNKGQKNTAIGARALSFNTTASNNTALGYDAGSNLTTPTTGSNNVALGYSAGSNLTTGSNNIYIGANVNGIAGESNACRIGSIFGRPAANGSAVFITSGHKLGTATSSKRFKENINPMNRASEVIFSLKPVAFRYKKEIDPERIPQFGLVAEDVEKVNPDLIVRDKEGKPYSVRYEAVNAMLLNEFLKEHKGALEEHRKVEKLEATVAGLVATVKEQASQIQKVSAHLEVSKPAPELVNNP
jgi:hypothetical protein